ncbi:MAG: TolC family protein [Acidobacteriota bacterium]|nr:TolC family protein [Acidobacteriota bacterium]
MKSISPAALLVLAVSFRGGAFAQPEPAIPPVKPLEVPPRIGVLGTAEISLNEVIQRVLANDRDLAVSRILLEEARYNVKSALGYYDPRFGLNAYKLRQVTPTSSVIGGGANGKLTQENYVADPQISGSSPYLGGTYKLDFSSARQVSDSTFLTLNPQYPTSINLSLTQPLLRGLFYDDNRHRIQVARGNVRLTNAQLRQRVIEIATQAVQSYWELDYAYRNLEVQIEAVRLAEQQDASNRRQVEQGLLAPIDVVQTQTQAATFQQNVFTAQQALTSAENALKYLMLADRTDMMWSMALVPQRTPEPRAPLPTLDEAVKAALAARPELAESATSIEINQFDTRLSHEVAKPQIDVYANLSLTGLAGSLVPSGSNPLTANTTALANQVNILSALAGIAPVTLAASGTVPRILVGGYGQSLSALASGKFTTAQVGVQISLPLRNRTAHAQEAVSLAEGRRLKTVRQQLEMAIEQDVRNALQTDSSARARLDAAISARQYAEQQYSSEQRQFQAGTSTVFLVLQRQSELITARTREVRASADLGEAQANYDRSVARTIEARGIEVQ